jgi:hypothetical protein
MRTSSILVIAAIALLAPVQSASAEDAPEFTLGDIGVRVDLPRRTWKMTRWSDWDFKAETTDGGVLLFAWSTPVQTPIVTADAWGPVFTAKVEELKGANPKVSGGHVEKALGTDVAYVDVEFTFGEDGPGGRMYGATVPVAGQSFHMAFVVPLKNARRGEEARDQLIKRLEVLQEATELPYGATVEAEGITTTLPEGWREPLDSERESFAARIGKLGVDDLEPCWVAIRPVPAAEPDLMVTCQGGLLLGVVDEHSFEAADALVRERMFGRVEVPPTQPVTVGDRVGFAYAPVEGLAVGVVPYDKGVARTWVVGGEGVDEALLAAMQGSTYSGPHPASVGQQVSYWLVHRTFSPVVLCPLLGVGGIVFVVGLGGLGLMMRGGRNKYDLDDEDL